MAPARVLAHDRIIMGTLVDLSVCGARVRHNGQLKSGPVGALSIGDNPFSATLVWVSDDEVGVSFNPPLQDEVVTKIISGQSRAHLSDVRTCAFKLTEQKNFGAELAKVAQQ